MPYAKLVIDVLNYSRCHAQLTYQRALHCLGDLRTSSDEIRAHWFLPYFITAALRISS